LVGIPPMIPCPRTSIDTTLLVLLVVSPGESDHTSKHSLEPNQTNLRICLQRASNSYLIRSRCGPAVIGTENAFSVPEGHLV
jgi:hypothetical protein